MDKKQKDNLKNYIDKNLGDDDNNMFFRDLSIKMSLIGFCKGFLYDKDRKEELIIKL